MLMENLKEANEINYVIHKHTVDGEIEYQLSLQSDEGELEFLTFPRTGNMATISNKPNITRLLGTLSEDTRDVGWLDYQGVESPSSAYDIVAKGVARIGKNTEKYTELYFNEENLSGRWILRKIPNVFDKAKFGDAKVVYLLWKPPRQKTYAEAFQNIAYFSETKCACAVSDMSAKFHELVREEGVESITKIVNTVSFNHQDQTFEGTAMAEGTWTDMYGNTYIYTPEFVVHTYNKQKEQGDIPLSTEHDEFGESFDGHTTGVRLIHKPIKHIVVNGVYNGTRTLSEGETGLSYEYKFKSVWNEDFQAWVPFESITDKLSVVNRPACKICWITKVN